MGGFRFGAALALAALIATPGLAQTRRESRGDTSGAAAILTPPKTGEQVYRQVCQACHMADGKGGSGAATIPALADNPRLSNAAYPIALVVNGRGAMPGFTDLLGPAQIAEVVSYVRTHFANSYAKPVTEANVAKIEGSKPVP